MLTLFFLSLALILSLVFYFIAPEVLGYEYVFVLCSISILSFIAFSLKKEKNIRIKGQWLRHSFVFLFSYFIVHFQYPFDLLIGNSELKDGFIWIDEGVVISSLALAVIGLLAFMVGYILRGDNFNGCTGDSVVSSAFLLYFSVISIVIYFIYIDPSYLRGGYGRVGLSSDVNYIALIFKVFIFSYLIQQSRNLKVKEIKFNSFLDYAKNNGFVFNLIFFIYLVSVMLSGDRGPIIYWSLAYYGCYLFVASNKLGLAKTFIYLFVGVLFISSLGHVRSMDRSMSFAERFSSSLSLDRQLEGRSFSPQTQELASSIRTVHMAVDFVPKSHDFLYGRFQYQQLISVIPFSNTVLTFFFSDTSYQYNSSAKFLTWVEQGANRSSGVGSSVIADFYLDFGVLGVLVGMFFFGFTIRHSEVAMYSEKLPGYFNHALFLCLLSAVVYIPRSSFLMELKFVAWVYAILVLNKLVVMKLRGTA